MEVIYQAFSETSTLGPFMHECIPVYNKSQFTNVKIEDLPELEQLYLLCQLHVSKRKAEEKYIEMPAWHNRVIYLLFVCLYKFI